MNTIKDMMYTIHQQAKEASAVLACSASEIKNKALEIGADKLWEQRHEIIAANAKDLEFGRSKDLSPPMMDRLFLDENRIKSICDGLRYIAKQEDPIGKVLSQWDQPNGLNIRRVRTPLGVIGVIYESRPNVTADAGALCLKAGNASILRSGSESFNSSTAIHSAMVEGLLDVGLPEHSIQLVPTRERAAVGEMLRANEYIDVIIPRGGKSLVARVQADARVPVFAHLEGVCHIYIDRDADLEKTRRVVMNSKTRRTGICGAVESLLIDRAFFDKYGAPFINELIAAGVEVRGDACLQTIKGVVPAGAQDWGVEYLDMIISAKIVDGLTGGIEHLKQYSSSHTDCIMSENMDAVEEFFSRVDSAILMHNTSTQFADGGEFGMGAEIGIATGKTHARGPIGAEQLTSFKYLVRGNGTIRP